MRLYDNVKSGYEQLKLYYPVWYEEILEMDAILRTTGKQLDSVRAGIIQAIDNCFVDTADMETIAKLENFLYITCEKSHTLEERRNRVRTYMIGTGKMSATKIKNIIKSLTGAESKVEFINDSKNNAILNITLLDADYNKYSNDILEIFNRKLPAHIFYKIFFFAMILSQSNIHTGICAQETTKETHFIDTGGVRHIYGTVLRESSEERYFIS